MPTHTDSSTNPICAICSQQLTSGNTVMTPCRHFFHKSCIRDHLFAGLVKTCPTCHGNINLVPGNPYLTVGMYRHITLNMNGTEDPITASALAHAL
ncbi:MAG: hypothetical protein J0M02_14100 [Planctomycetes bacterium]|nr:hypothetical protein [Planctomycetota bacterium]